jgi:uncharacterized SAM-binding protein YcdF (DUF218 family)
MTMPPITGNGARPTAAARPRASVSALLAVFVYATGLATLVSVLAFGLGFVWFVLGVPDREQPPPDRADGIVVLTGGASRIADAMELLSQKRGQRLLISGVHRETSLSELTRQVPVHTDLFACCVDPGYAALNTIGNAAEARQWMDRHGYRSVVLVTSAWHMRRAEAEFRRQMPDADIRAFPVISETLAMRPWWSSLETTKLLFGEYVKYTVALLRMRLEDWPSATVANRVVPGDRS